MKKRTIFSLSLILGFFAVLAMMLSFSIPANSAQWDVHPGESIQAKIDDPNVDAGDEIIVHQSTYIENIDFKGKAITVRSTDPNDLNVIANTIIDGNQVASVVTFNTNEGNSSVISGLTLKKGKGSFLGGIYYGGGIYCNNSSPTIENCIITENGYKDGNYGVNILTYFGGGIYCEKSSLIIRNCIIRGNKSRTTGGGIYCGGGVIPCLSEYSPTIIGCNIYENYSPSGGGIGFVCSNPSIIECTISRNEALNNGGGLHCNDSSANITGCTITSNITNGDGGGISCYNTITRSKIVEITNCNICKNKVIGGPTYSCGGGMYCTGASPIVTNCTINENWAHFGGGVSCQRNSSPIFTNCLIAYNKACNQTHFIEDSSGGGISCGAYNFATDNSSPIITNCTIGFNMASGKGGGIFCRSTSSAKITNSILWGNTINGNSEEISVDGTSYLTTVSYSDIQMPPGQIYPGEENKNENPLFADIMGHLLPFSPCIDANTNTDPNIVLDFDKDGISRPQDGNRDGVDKYDMGAYEFPSDYEMPEVRLPEYVVTHFTETGCDENERKEGYFNPYYGKDADNRWMNRDKHGHPYDNNITPSYNNYHNETTCNNAVKVTYDELGNPINDNDYDGIPNEIEAFEQAVFQATGYHCDILNYNLYIPVEYYLLEDHPNIQIVNNVIWENSLLTVIFPPNWRKDGSHPVLLQSPGLYTDLNAMYLSEDERRFAIWVGQSKQFGDGLIVIRSNNGGWETEGFHEDAINDIGSFLEAMTDYGADTSRVITFKERGGRDGNAALIWGANPYGYDYNALSMHAAYTPFKVGSYMPTLSISTFPGYCTVLNNTLGSPNAFRYDYQDEDQNPAETLSPQEKADLFCGILLNVSSNEADTKSAYGYFEDPNLTDSLQEKRITVLYGTHDSFIPMSNFFDLDYLLKEKEIPHKLFLGYCIGHDSEPVKDYVEDINNTLIELSQGNIIFPHNGHIREYYMPRDLVNIERSEHDKILRGSDYKTLPIDPNYLLITDEVIDQINSTNGYEDYFDTNHNASKLAFSATIPYKVVKGKPFNITLMGEEGKSWEIWCRKEDGYNRALYCYGVFGESVNESYAISASPPKSDKEYVILNLIAGEETGRYEWFFSYDGKEIPNRFTPYLDQNSFPEKAITEVPETEPNEHWGYFHPSSTGGMNHGVAQYHPLLLKENNHPELLSITDPNDSESKPIENIYLIPGETVSLQINACDPDNDKLVYDLRDPNNQFINHYGLDFNGLTGAFSLSIDEQDPNDYELRLRAIVKDGKGGMDEKHFTVKVMPLCLQLCPYKDILYLTILPDGQIRGYGYSYESGEYLVGGWQDVNNPSLWVLFVDMEPDKGHSYEYGFILGNANTGSLYVYDSDGDPCEDNPFPVTLNYLTAGQNSIGSYNLSDAGNCNFVQGVPGGSSSTYCYEVTPFCDRISLNFEPDGRFTGHGYSNACPYLIGGLLVNENWVLFCDFLPTECGHDFEYGVIGGWTTIGSLYRYYPDGTLFHQDKTSIMVNTIDCNSQTVPICLNSMTDDQSSVVEDPNATIWISVILEVPRDFSSVSFEVIYDPNFLLYLEYETGDLASYITQLDVRILDPGRLEVEVFFEGGIIPSPVNAFLLRLGFKKKQSLEGLSSIAQQFDFSSQALANFSSGIGNFTIDFQDNPTLQSHDIPKGWSMFSLPVISDNTSVSSVFSDHGIVYGFKDNGYKQMEPEDKLEDKKGYWILMNQEKTVDLTGQPLTNYILSVNNNGWYMIGGCSKDAKPSSDDCTIKVIYGYEQGVGYKRVPKSANLKPWKGYWILLEDVVDQCELKVEIIDTDF